MRFFLELRPYVDYTQLKLFLLWAKFVLRLIRFSIKTNTSRGLSNLPMTHLESIASSAVRPTLKVKAFVIIGLTSSGRAARLIAKYRPTMPVLSVVIPRLKTNQLKWSFSGAFEVYHFLKFYNI